MRALFRSISQVAVLLALLCPPSMWMAVASFAAEHVATVKTLSLGELEHGISDRLKKVQEFKFIEGEAAKLGVRAWLFGGTAAGYAHYVKWDLQRENGDPRFQPDRFDYDYTNIYRSTQDLDIVIDGNVAQAQTLQSALAQKYPHLQGSKTAWEVRLLTQDMGDKLAILNNPDFMNQHTDSNSTGLIEITKPKAGEAVVRDVRDWNSTEPYFLKDVRDGALHYYHSPLHETTKFAKEGRNLPIIAAIRYLTKAFQYELKLRPEDLAQIKKVIDDFDPKRGTQNSYVAHWIEKNGKKLIQNAVNIEYAWVTLEQLGLRKKLQVIQGNVNDIDSLAWWMNKEPLKTTPLGNTGKTAKELGLDIVAHETHSFQAYESITRAHTGDPNVLISRSGEAGELARYGNGFYTQVGREGARGTGLTIRFHLDPDARENIDFTRVKFESGEDFIVVKNKAALKVIPESLNLGPVEYFKMLALNNANLSHSDLGIMEKLKRRIGSKIQALSESEAKEIVKIVEWSAKHTIVASPAVKTWFELPISTRYPQLVEDLSKTPWLSDSISDWVKDQPHWANAHPRLTEALKNKGWDGRTPLHSLVQGSYADKWHGPAELIDMLFDDMEGGNQLVKRYWSVPEGTIEEGIIRLVLSDPDFKPRTDWVEKLLKEKPRHAVNMEGRTLDALMAAYAFSKPHWKEHPEPIETLLKKGTADSEIATHVLSQPHWKDHPEWVETLIQRGKADQKVANNVLSKPHWANHPELVDALIKKGTVDKQIAEYILSQPHWNDHPEWVETLIQRGNADLEIARYVLSKPHWKDHPQLVEALIKKGTVDDSIIRWVFSQPHASEHPELVEAIIKKRNWNWKIAREVLPNGQWTDHPKLVTALIDNGYHVSEVAEYILSSYAWTKHPELVEGLIQKVPERLDATALGDIAKHVLSSLNWHRHPELVKSLIKKITPLTPNETVWEVKNMLLREHWKDHPELRRLAGEAKPTIENLQKGMEQEQAGLSPALCLRARLNRALKLNK